MKGFINILAIIAIGATILSSAFYVSYKTNQALEKAEQEALGATIIQTELTNTIGTFRTNVNTSLTNVNNALSNATSGDPGHYHTLSNDASATGTLTIAKGGTGTSTTPSASSIWISDGTNIQISTIPNCSTAVSQKIIYTSSTRTFSCETDRGINVLFGGGSDGDATLTASTTLTADKFYNDLTINSGVVINTAGYRLYVKGTLTNNGTIRNNGGNGGNASGATGGSAGAVAPGAILATSSVGIIGATALGDAACQTGGAGGSKNPSLGVNGVAGGASGQNSFRGSCAGGGAGTATSENLVYTPLVIFTSSHSANATTTTNLGIRPDGSVSTSTLSVSAGSGAGSAGPGDGASTGGGGGGSGGSGGIVSIVANTISGSGTFQAIGGNGGNGGNATGNDAGGGGGGSGGSGGVIVFFYETFNFTGTISVAGGSLGTGGTKVGGSATNGSSGNNGGTGNVYRIVLP